MVRWSPQVGWICGQVVSTGWVGMVSIGWVVRYTCLPSLMFQAYRSISKCVAAICDSVPGETFDTVDKFITDIKVSFY